MGQQLQQTAEADAFCVAVFAVQQLRYTMPVLIERFVCMRSHACCFRQNASRSCNQQGLGADRNNPIEIGDDDNNSAADVKVDDVM